MIALPKYLKNIFLHKNLQKHDSLLTCHKTATIDNFVQDREHFSDAKCQNNCDQITLHKIIL